MSNIYIQEPPTSGKVLLKTSVGDIDIELWAKETPKACRNFIQLCMEGYYNGTIFHRVVKGFIAQGGDPDGNGTGGESIYGETFKDEFHSRLRFIRRGLVAMANSGVNDNGSQFFFTLGATPELQNKHTLFGKVTGDTVYNMIKLEDGVIDADERPKYPHRIIKAEVLHNPFEDIEPRNVKGKEKREKKQKREKGVKNFGLLSFGEEAEGDEQETDEFVKKTSGKSKSTHDVLDDPKLSRETAALGKSKPERGLPEEEEEEDGKDDDEGLTNRRDDEEVKKATDTIRNKLKSKTKVIEAPADDDDEDYDDKFYLHRERDLEKKKRTEEIRQEILEVKKAHQVDKKRKLALTETEKVKDVEKKQKSELMEEYLGEKDKYSHLKKDLPKKGSSREAFTLQLLEKFKSKLYDAKEKVQATEAEPGSSGAHSHPTTTTNPNPVPPDDVEDENWLGHELHFEEKVPVLAKDAATKEDDWYDVYDPRNPLNKRRREANAKSSGKPSHRKPQ